MAQFEAARITAPVAVDAPPRCGAVITVHDGTDQDATVDVLAARRSPSRTGAELQAHESRRLCHDGDGDAVLAWVAEAPLVTATCWSYRRRSGATTSADGQLSLSTTVDLLLVPSSEASVCIARGPIEDVAAVCITHPLGRAADRSSPQGQQRRRWRSKLAKGGGPTVDAVDGRSALAPCKQRRAFGAATSIRATSRSTCSKAWPRRVRPR